MGVQRFMYVHMHEDEDEDEGGSESIGIKKINLHPTNRLYHVEWYICTYVEVCIHHMYVE